MKIFNDILELRSFTAIGYMVDDALPTATGETREALLRMQDTNKLDEIYAIAHEQLGQHEEAVKLRQWLAQRATRLAYDPMLDPHLVDC